MSEQELRRLLDEAAEPVAPPTLAESSWRQAGVRRRRRRLGASGVAAALAVVLVGGGLLTVDRHDPDRSTTTARASAGPSGRTCAVHPSQGASEWYWEPAGPGQLPCTIDMDPSHAEKLSAHPLNGPAVGLFAAYPDGWPQRLPTTMPILVLGPDGRMRRIDTATIRTSGNGYEPAPLLPGALDSAGTKAAFPQPGGTVRVVDLTGDGSSRYRVGDGVVRSMWWVGSDRLVLSTDNRTRIVDLPGGDVTTLRIGAAFAPREPTRRSEFVAFARQAAAAGTQVRRYGPDGRLLDTRASDRWYLHWYGPGIRDEDWAVSAAIGTRKHPNGGGNSIVAVPLRAGERTRAVDCPSGDGPHRKAPCVPLGWVGDDRVLVLDHLSPSYQLLVANVRNGGIAKVARLTRDGQVALRPGIS